MLIPAEDLEVHEESIDLSKVELQQVGPMIQVSGLHGGKALGGLTAFDILCEVDGQHVSRVDQINNQVALVRYLRWPYGKTNPIPTDVRGWVYLERFITMLKAAMIDHDAFDHIIFTNSEDTKQVLRNGGNGLHDSVTDAHAPRHTRTPKRGPLY